MIRSNFKPKPLKKRKCKHCKTDFLPPRQLMPFCSPMCEIIFNGQKPKKLKQAKARKDKSVHNWNDRKWLKETSQEVFNKFIRLRDARIPCVSCGTTNNIQYHASHYKPAGGYSYLRYDETNVHKACVRCNKDLAGNLVPYRVALIEKIGQSEVDRLEKPNRVKTWSVEEMQEIIIKYREKIKTYPSS